MTSPLVLAVDQGTTNTKAVLVDATGAAVASGSERVTVSFPQPGWVQTDAVHLLATVQAAVQRCVLAAEGRSPVALGLSNQRESVVAWSAESGEPLSPVVSWQCGRGAEVCRRLAERGDAARVQQISGLPLDPMFSAAKMRWILDSIRGGAELAAEGALLLGTVDAFLLWHLTGGEVHATDLTNASRTQLFDLERREWSEELLAVFGVPRAALPEVRPSSARFGTVREGGALGVPGGVVIGAVAGDSHAALVGHGALRPGSVKATFGTGTSVLAPTQRLERSEHLASTVAWSGEDHDGTVHVVYGLEGNIYATGAAIEWATDLLGLDRVEELTPLAGVVSADDEVVLVPALSGLGAPHWESRARGTITGLTRASGRADLARAAFAAIGHQVADVLDELARVTSTTVERLAVDGGATHSSSTTRAVADIAGVRVCRSEAGEVAALGAALLAARSTGAWPGVDAVGDIDRPVTVVDPTWSDEERLQARRRWAQALAAVRAAIPGDPDGQT